MLRDWPDSEVPANTLNATIATIVLNEAINRLVITVASVNVDADSLLRKDARMRRFYPAAARRPSGYVLSALPGSGALLNDAKETSASKARQYR